MLALLDCMLLKAQYVEINGVRYELSDSGTGYQFEAKVLKKSPSSKNNYTGDLVIPKSIEHEGKTYTVSSIDSAFQNCSNLTSVELPNSLKVISPYSFYGCEGLTSIRLPDSLKIIGYSAFAGCTGLKSIEFPENLEHVRDKAFSNCSNLSTVFIRSPFMGAATSSFDGCIQLRDVVCYCDPKFILFPIAQVSACYLHVPSENLDNAKKSLMGFGFAEILEINDFNMGLLYMNIKQYDLSEYHLLKVLNLYLESYNQYPTSYSAHMGRIHNSLAYLYAYKEDYSKAIEEIDKAINYVPKEANYFDSKGEILFMKGDKKGALEMWQKVLELNPSFEYEMGYKSKLLMLLTSEGMIKTKK